MASLELIELNVSERVKALERLGYSLNNEGYVLDKDNKEITCDYTNERVHIKTAAILPGSLLIINATPLSMARYFIEHPEDG